MDAALLLSNLANPPVLFFFLGMLAVWLRSDLEIPPPVPKFLEIYLLFTSGTFHVGFVVAAPLAHATLPVFVLIGLPLYLALINHLWN